MHPEYGLPSYPDKYFDLAIVDPPYGIGVNNNMGRRRGDKKSQYVKIDWDYAPPNKEYFNELERVSKNQIIWGANHFIDLIGKRSPCWVVWDKGFSPDVTFAQCELAYASFSSTAKIASLGFWNNTARIHPTQKPVALYRWLLENYAQPGQLILDTHVGSASSLIACESMGFDYVGFEIDPDYYEAAKKRMAKGIQLVIQ
jgi:site-specific DNA-methyltransferase (adenine-specific)